MAMSKRAKRELRKLREIVRVALHGERCRFCRKPLLEPVDFAAGDGQGPPLTEKVTVHHKNGDHDDNRPENHALAHQSCHKRHHALEILHGKGGRAAKGQVFWGSRKKEVTVKK